MNSKKEKQAPSAARPVVPYWEDPVYPYLVRCHHGAVDTGDDSAAVRFEGLMQELINRSMTDELYWQLDAEAKADRKKRKHESKQRRRPSVPPSVVDGSPAVHIANLKKRIFSPSVSRENVIKALEALPPAERKATVATLPPGLVRKLGSYLRGKRR